MSIPGSASPLFLSAAAAAAPAGYQIDRSLRFNNDDSAYLNRTPSSAGNRKTWTWSGWVKRSELGREQSLLSCGNSTNNNTFGQIIFAAPDYLSINAYSISWRTTTQAFRDPSAWYHIVVAFDTTQATASDRVKLYVNGSEVTQFRTNNTPAQNTDYAINQNIQHTIGRYDLGGGGNYLSAYLADVHFIDGQALDPTDFGEYDDNNVWQPKAYTFGTNPNNGTTWSSTTNGNFWTAISRGADKAFNGNVNATDYAQATVGNTATVSGLGITGITSIRVNIAKNSGGDSWGTFALDSTDLTSWLQSNYAGVGNSGTWIDVTSQFASSTLGSISITSNTSSTDVRLAGVEINGYVLIDGAGDNSFHLDFSDNSSNAALGDDSSGNNNDWTVNNLVADAPATASGGFDVVTYSGNSSTQNITGLDFQPDLVWIKTRNDTSYHFLTDSVRGVNKHLASNATDQEGNVTAVTAFNSDGFSLANQANVNASPYNYVAWCWKAGGAAVSNTDGTITSQVSANTTYGFSIVTFNMGSNGAKTVGHGLNAEPYLIITKCRTDAFAWRTYHKSATTIDQQFELNSNGAVATSVGHWGSAAPTSSVFGITSGQAQPANEDCVAYCWSEVSGFSKFGTWQHNNTNTGPKITTGFKPRFLLIKNSDNAEQWFIFDTVRMPTNSQSGANNTNLRPNSTGAEGSYTMNATVNFLDDGFQVVTTTPDELAFGTRNYIYAAFAEQPDRSVIDSLIDTPTNADTPTDTGAGNEVVGNYCTWNPNASSSSMILSNGNLESKHAGGWVAALGSIGVNSGKWYWEMTLQDGTNHMYGVAYDQPNLAAHNTTIYGYYNISSQTFALGAQGVSYGSSSTTGDIIGVALDLSGGGTNGTLTFYKNNTSMGTAFSNIDCSKTYFPWVLENGNSVGSVANFGQRAFAYTAPSGFKALCTANLPDPTIADGSTAMDALLFTGNGGSQTLSGLGFSPDFTWFKARSFGFSHELLDIVRGGTKVLFSDLTNAESTNSSLVTSFNSDGVSIGSALGANGSSRSSVLWAWDGGTSTVTNTDGSITSTVRANASAGFSVISYSGAGSNASFGHGLNVAPGFFIIKNRDASTNWMGYHSSSGKDAYYDFNTSNAVQTTISNIWGSTGPSSSVINLTGSYPLSNRSGDNYICYCWAPVAGYSSFGSYTGNGSADGPFVFTGFRPRWLMIKSVNYADNWLILDAARETFNVMNTNLRPNSSSAETVATNDAFDFVSNGFKIRGGGAVINTNNAPFIYACFSEHPFKTARAR